MKPGRISVSGIHRLEQLQIFIHLMVKQSFIGVYYKMII